MVKPLVAPALVILTAATTCADDAAIAVAPGPAANVESASDRAFAATGAVAGRHRLEPFVASNQAEERWRQCFIRETFILCGKVNAPEVQFYMYQSRTTRFTPWADSVRREMLDTLRTEFGESRVRECEWERWPEERRSGCLILAERRDD
jgi:hypothetical protein